MSVELPPFVAQATSHLPLYPLERFLQLAANKAYLKHQEKLDRLQPYLKQSFAINPVDLDWQALITFQSDYAQLKLTRNPVIASQADVRIAAPLLVLLELLEGQGDGDAHFFSRDLVVEGNTEAVLALRNTLDNAEVDFLTEVTEMFGPLAQPLRWLLVEANQKIRKKQPGHSSPSFSPTEQPNWSGEDENQGLYPS